MTPRRARFVGLAFAACPIGCGSNGGSGFSLDVGSDDGGSSFTISGDAGGTGALTAHIEQNHIAVTFVTLSCTRPCADVVAVPTGGHAPYTFKWDDGLTSAARHACPTSSTSYNVTVTDTGSVGEITIAPESAQASVTAEVLKCPDGGADASTALGSAHGFQLLQPTNAPSTGVTVGIGQGGTVYWADWQTIDAGTVTGILSPPSGTIQVTYTGTDLYGAQTTSGTNDWTPASTYTSQTVPDAPPGPGIVQIMGGITQPDSITFSEAVTNPVVALLSLGTAWSGQAAVLQFSAPFVILSSGPDFEGIGTTGILTEVDGGVTGVEGSGVVELEGTF